MTAQYSTQALLIGQKAAELLDLPGYSGEVLAVVSSAIYLVGDDGEIVWVAQPGSAAHRRCILSPCFSFGIETGLRFTAIGKRLSIGEVMTIDLSNADLWVPRPVEQALSQRVTHNGFGETVTPIYHLPLKGLGHTLKLISPPSGGGGNSTASVEETILLKRAEPVITDLIAACRSRDMPSILSLGLALVGLGPGLTPSGDDYMGGLLFMAHHLKAVFHGELGGEGNLIPGFLGSARRLTNRISYTILYDLTHGHGPAPLHDLVSLLLQTSTTPQLLAGVKQVIRIGHTSGWDMLAGLFTGLLLKENITARDEQ